MFAGNLEFLKANLHVIPAVVLASLARVVVASFTMLALSSLSKSTRYVVDSLRRRHLLYRSDLRRHARHHRLVARRRGFRSRANLENVTDVMFRQTPRYDAPVIVSVLVLLGLLVVSISVLERRVRGVEVVS